MGKIYFGCGGFQFFKAPGDPLLNYSRIFDYVEINSSFYNIPKIETCKKWKEKVSHKPEFFFTVKANHELTHKYKLQPIKESYEIFDKMKKVCRALGANILVLQTSRDLQLDTNTIKNIDDFFSSVSKNDLDLVWEARGQKWMKNGYKKKFEMLLKNYNITQCVDYSRENPIYYPSNLAYTRIFGLGEGNKYQFDDNQIKKLNTKFINTSNRTEKLVVSFHTQRMVHDAARAKEYNKTGRFISSTASSGISSFLEGINEFRKYPTTKKELITNHGWKLFNLDKDTRKRMNYILKSIEDRKYHNENELVLEIKKFL